MLRAPCSCSCLSSLLSGRAVCVQSHSAPFGPSVKWPLQLLCPTLPFPPLLHPCRLPRRLAGLPQHHRPQAPGCRRPAAVQGPACTGPVRCAYFQVPNAASLLHVQAACHGISLAGPSAACPAFPACPPVCLSQACGPPSLCSAQWGTTSRATTAAGGAGGMRCPLWPTSE